MKLSIFQNSVDLSLKMDDFTKSPKSIDLSLGEILIGFNKPLKNFYVELVEREDTEDSLSLKYFNGSTWEDVPGVEDRTFGLTISGMVSFPELTQEPTVLHSKDQYWLKLTTSTPAIISINAINLVLSSDQDFGSNKKVLDYLPEGETSFVAYHQEARDILISDLRKSNQRIINSNLDTKLIDQFDLIDIEEFRQASKFLALALIYENISRSDEDSYSVQAKRFMTRYQQSFGEMLVTIDLNDNGMKDDAPAPVSTLSSIRIKHG
jgi:hypothetical protein